MPIEDIQSEVEEPILRNTPAFSAQDVAFNLLSASVYHLNRAMAARESGHTPGIVSYHEGKAAAYRDAAMYLHTLIKQHRKQCSSPPF